MWWAMARPVERLMVRRRKRRGRVYLSDTTLRDGEQMAGVRLGPDAKLAIARALADAGIDSIDAGFPAASAEERDAIRRIVAGVRGPVITALCRTARADIDHAADALAGGATYKTGVTLFVGVSPQHRRLKLARTRAEVVRMTVEAVRYARRTFRIVAVGAEDASRAEPEFLHEVYREAIAAGASTVGFADTLGILTPEKAADRVKAIQDGVPELAEALLAVHFHDDLGLGTANALACVAAGANIVQGTINGLGERAGNTPLEEVALALALHRDQYRARARLDLRRLRDLGALVSRLTGVAVPPNKAVVGANLFVTEAGIHQDGLLKDASTYLPYPPEAVGAGAVRLALGKHSGRHAVLHRLEGRGWAPDEGQVLRVLDHLKGRPRRVVYVTEAEIDELVVEVFGDTSALARVGP